MNRDHIHMGLHVTTHPDGEFPRPVRQEFLDARCEGVSGVVMGAMDGDYSSGHWWVRHLEEGSVAPYSFFELEENLSPPKPHVRFFL